MISRSCPPAWKTFRTSGVVDHQFQQRRQVQPVRFGIDRGRFLLVADLNEAQIRPIGVLAHELRVHGDKGMLGEALAQGLERVGVGDQRMNVHVSAP
jgi:hypothetical protein